MTLQISKLEKYLLQSFSQKKEKNRRRRRKRKQQNIEDGKNEKVLESDEKQQK